MAQDSKSRKLDQYIVRFPDGMRERIKAAAEKNNRSMNAEIVKLIDEGFEQRAHFEWIEAQHRTLEEDDPYHQLEQMQREMEERFESEKRQNTNSVKAVDVSAQLERLENKIENLTKGLVVYGRAFEMSVGGDQNRGADILEKAIDEVEAQGRRDENTPAKKKAG